MIETIGEALNKKLSNLNLEFENNSRTLLGLSEEEKEVKKFMKLIEIKETNIVLEAVHIETKKSKYKNQTERDNAISKVLNSNELYQEHKAKSNKLNREIKSKTTELDILKFQQRGIIVQMNYQIALIGGKE